jgi:hypothetical protein
MTTFDDRERAFETKFAQDEELEFRALARRDRLLGEWAGGKLGKSGDELAAYAQEIVRTDIQTPGDEDVLQRLAADLDGRVTEAEIRARMDSLLVECRAAVKAGA